MIITCEACGTSYRLKTSRVKESGSKVRCSKCQHVFIVYPPSVLSDKSTAQDSFSGVEGTATMEFFGAIEADARSVESRNARAAEGDTISGLEEMIEKEGAGKVRQEAASGSLFGEAASPGTATMDIGELTRDPGRPSGVMMDIGELTREPSAAGEAVMDIGELTQEDWTPEEDLLDFDDLTASGAGDVYDLSFFEAKSFPEQPEAEAETGIDVEDIVVSSEDEDLFDETDIPEEAIEGPEPSAQPEAEMDLDAFTVMAETSEFSAETEAFELDLNEDELKGGGDKDLDDFDLDKESRQKPLEPPSEEAESDEFELDPDFDEGHEAAAEEDEADDDFYLDLDLGSDAEAVESSVGEDEEFELDLEEPEPEPEAIGRDEAEEQFDLEFDFDLDESASGETELDTAIGETAGGEDEFELDLDFDESPSGESAAEGVGEDSLDLGLEVNFERKAPVLETVDEDWALDLDEFALDLKDEGEGTATVDLDEDDFDLVFDLDAEDEATEVLDTFDIGDSLEDSEQEFDLDLDFSPDTEEAQFELDLEFEAEDEGPETEDFAEDEVFELNLDLEPDEAEATEGALDFGLGSDETSGSTEDELDFELDFDLVPEEGTVAVGEIPDSLGEPEKTEEFDLSEIEDFLEEEALEPASSRTLSESTELELDLESEAEDSTLAPETEPKTETGGVSEEELDLETMLNERDQWSTGESTELSMETVEEKRAAMEAEQELSASTEAADQTIAFKKSDSAEALPSRGPSFKRRKRSRIKPLLIALLILLILGALAVAGIFYFGFEDRIPYIDRVPYVSDMVSERVVVDQGNQQMAVTPNPEYRFIDNENAGELLVINGEVTNRYDQPRSFVKLETELYDAEGQVLQSTTTFAGNVIAEAELTGSSLEALQIQLANRGGDDNANVGIPPGESVPFMVVLGNLPAKMVEFSVEVDSSVKE